MVAPNMANLKKFLQLPYLFALMVVVLMSDLGPSESTLLVYFTRTPPPQSRSSNAVFQYLVQSLDGTNACERNACSFSCEVCGFSLSFICDMVFWESLHCFFQPSSDMVLQYI